MAVFNKQKSSKLVEIVTEQKIFFLINEFSHSTKYSLFSKLEDIATLQKSHRFLNWWLKLLSRTLLVSVIDGYSYRNKIFRVFVIHGQCYLASYYMTRENSLFSDFVQ